MRIHNRFYARSRTCEFMRSLIKILYQKLSHLQYPDNGGCQAIDCSPNDIYIELGFNPGNLQPVRVKTIEYTVNLAGLLCTIIYAKNRLYYFEHSYLGNKYINYAGLTEIVSNFFSNFSLSNII